MLIDVGNIFMQKINLNNSVTTVTQLYQNNSRKELLAYVAKEDLDYDEHKVNNDMVELTLKKNIKVSAPILNKILGKKIEIKASKTIYDKEKDE